MNSMKFNFDNSYLQLPSCLYSLVDPMVVNSPDLVVINNKLLEKMGLVDDVCLKEKALIFSGSHKLHAGGYFSQAYAGHQFGHFSVLGDGRAIMLGEHVTPAGQRYDVQLKGAGITPYSRRGDGRAVLGPMLREYVISSAFDALNIPTTSSLAVTVTGETVQREVAQPGAVLTRVADSHLRIGTFEFAALQDDQSVLKELLDYSVARHYPLIPEGQGKAEAFLFEVMLRQIACVVDWMRVGFIHGVMNTDNTTISGESMDYGPCAFMDEYDPKTVFSSIDTMGRYCFENQPVIIQWNLACLAESLLPLISQNKQESACRAETIISQFPDLYRDSWHNMMKSKLGLLGDDERDCKLISEFLLWMQNNHLDYTNTFRDFSDLDFTSECFTGEEFKHWYRLWDRRQSDMQVMITDVKDKMRQVNPRIIPRNHYVDKVIRAAENNDYKPLHQLLEALEHPYEYHKVQDNFSSPPLPGERIFQTYCGV